MSKMTLEEVADDYGFPIEFIMDVLCRWGVSPPINELDRLGDVVTGEQAYALSEALTTCDPASVRDFYLAETLEELADELGVTLADVFSVCGRYRLSLPLGAETHLTRDDYKLLLKELEKDEKLAIVSSEEIKEDSPLLDDYANAILRGALRQPQENDEDPDGAWSLPGEDL